MFLNYLEGWNVKKKEKHNEVLYYKYLVKLYTNFE